MNLDILGNIIQFLSVSDIVNLLMVNKEYYAIHVWPQLIYRDFDLYNISTYNVIVYKQLYLFEQLCIRQGTYWSGEALLLMFQIYSKDVYFSYYNSIIYENINIFYDIFTIIKILYKCIVSGTTLSILDHYCHNLDYIDYYNTINSVLLLSNKNDVTSYEQLLHTPTLMYYRRNNVVHHTICDFDYFLSNTIVMEIVEKFPSTNKYMLHLLNKIEKLHYTFTL